MKQSLILLALAGTALTPKPALSADACTLPIDADDLTKTLQEALRVYHDITREGNELQAIASNLDGVGAEKSAADIVQGISTRVTDTKTNLQEAFAQLDNTQNIPLILAQAQGRLTAALGKFRGFKNLALDESKRNRINCSELRLQELNQRLKDLLKVPT